MTLNFGHKILLVLIGFGLLMGMLVFLSMQTDYELVSKNYYQEEIAYQEVIDARANAKLLSARVLFNITNNELWVKFPEEMKSQIQEGKFYFYAPSDSKKDKTIPIEIDTAGQQRIQIGKIIQSGNYDVKVEWKAAGKTYFQKTSLQLP